ncbi:MAG: MBL fold metallo-hydrolase [Oceanobacter sp.]
MRYISLGSGSKGNATLVEQNGHGILVDCGFSRKMFLSRLEQAGFDVLALRSVLVTHEHSDHSKGALSLCETLDIPLWCSHGTAAKMEWLDHPLLRILHNDELLSIDGLTICPVTVPHDAREPLQYVIEGASSKRLGILSDLGCITPHILSRYDRCHALQLESNYDPDMLRDGPYPLTLQRRVGGPHGHLSNQQSAELLRRLAWSGLNRVSVGHISEKNNNGRLVSQVFSQVMQCRPEEVELLEQDSISDWREVTL